MFVLQNIFLGQVVVSYWSCVVSILVVGSLFVGIDFMIYFVLTT